MELQVAPQLKERIDGACTSAGDGDGDDCSLNVEAIPHGSAVVDANPQ